MNNNYSPKTRVSWLRPSAYLNSWEGVSGETYYRIDVNDKPLTRACSSPREAWFCALEALMLKDKIKTFR